jgi:hypothetical protein
MRPTGTALALTLAAGLLSGAAEAKKPQFGVFGTVNGKKFKTVGTGKPDDRCVNGTYMAKGGVVFGAITCHRRNRTTRKNPSLLTIACGIIDPNVTSATPPFEAPCVVAGYTETKTRHGIPFIMKQWSQSLSLVPGADGTLMEHSSVNIRIDSFDGTYVRGAIFGVFDTPLTPGITPAQVPINGEVTFYFPVRGIAQ